MSTIYDLPGSAENVNVSQTSGTSVQNAEPQKQSTSFSETKSAQIGNPVIEHAPVITQEQPVMQSQISKEIDHYAKAASDALVLVDDIVMKKYLSNLSDMQIVEPESEVLYDNIILFKVNKMVYEKDEYATDKFISVVSSMTYAKANIFLIVDGHLDRTDFYLGVRSEDENRNVSYIAETLKNSLSGQFPGVKLEDMSIIAKGANTSKQNKLLEKIRESNCVSSCVGIPTYLNNKGDYTNANFIQGIEKFAIAMKGKEYTAIILASNVPSAEIVATRLGYENIYTELSTMANQQLAYSTNESLANAISRSKGITDTHSSSDTTGETTTRTSGETHTVGGSESTTLTKSESKDNFWGKASKVASPLIEAGAILAGTGVGAPLGGIMMGVGAIAGIGGVVASKQLSNSEATAKATNFSDAKNTSVAEALSNNHTDSDSHAESLTETNGKTSTIGASKNFTITVQNKHIQEILKRIDKQLNRIEACESTGIWATSAYFLSYGTDRSTAEIGATIFRSLILGEQSGVETTAINTWNKGCSQYGALTSYISGMTHPLFLYSSPAFGKSISTLPTSLISSKELSIMLGLPRKSVPGLPIIEHASFAKEVVRLTDDEISNAFKLGCIYDQGVPNKLNTVWLDTKSLCQHTFVTGSTGCGKSNTIYYLLSQIRNQPNSPKFLIIEPAKGEYKDVFGDEHIYGTNPLLTPLLKINPFRFPKGVHVLEHIDRLIEIFNVCWPMYAAMPAVLKQSILNAYEHCGWDLFDSINKYSNELFPTFADVKDELNIYINNSAYSEEVKSNYSGSLVTRIDSLNNGINGQIFSGDEIGDAVLFDENVIVDLSRVGSQETKSLIMGILLMRLNEYRSNSNIQHNSDLRHITVLEEAHNILKKCSQEQNIEGSNVAGKSVEMLTNAIAEMRTYGEGFIIVDQSPGAVDVSAIRNTNTKIIMRLPEESDRRVAGKSAGMKDVQIDEIAKLKTGVAVVYQNDWEAPVLCQIEEYSQKNVKYEYKGIKNIPTIQKSEIKSILIELFLDGRILQKEDKKKFDINLIKNELCHIGLSTKTIWSAYELIEEYQKSGNLTIWDDINFPQLSVLISNIFSHREDVIRLVATQNNFKSLDDSLCDLIKKYLPEINAQYIPELKHCLMCDYSLYDDVRKQVYNAWVQYNK